MQEKIPLIAVFGATASGKTSLSIAIAKAIGSSIISADSMQIYKEMNIATASPTEKEKDGVPHFLLNFVSPETPYSVYEYSLVAKKLIKEIYSKEKIIPIIVGGTGLYINAVLKNIIFSKSEIDKELREKLEKESGETLLSILSEKDPETAKRLSVNDKKRIIRAIEVYKTSGETFSSALDKSLLNPPPYKAFVIYIRPPRELLYDRINTRTDKMILDGLIEEAKAFYQKYKNSPTACAAIGYKEIEDFLLGNCSLEEATNNLKQKTRNYAKRQTTWFNKLCFEIERDYENYKVFVIENTPVIPNNDGFIEIITSIQKFFDIKRQSL